MSADDLALVGLPVGYPLTAAEHRLLAGVRPVGDGKPGSARVTSAQAQRLRQAVGPLAYQHLYGLLQSLGRLQLTNSIARSC